MATRLEHLTEWGLPEMLLRLANGDPPHPAFEVICEALRVNEHRNTWGLHLDQVQVRPEVCGLPTAAMWERDVGDGHAFEVVYCAKSRTGLEFRHVMYADDMPNPTSHLVAQSAQGLYFWLFFYLIQSEFAAHGDGAYGTLVAAAKAVEFEHLVEVFRLEEEIGSDYEREGELRERCMAIT